MGAYTNPKLYGLDFSVITEDTSAAAAKIAYATAKQQEERAKREKEFKDSYKDFINKAYLDANDYLGEEYRNTLNASYQDIENFANMSEADKQNIIRNVQATNAGMGEIAAKMPEIATMDIDIDKYDDPSVRLLGAMARGDRNAFKSIKDPNNPMLINWQYTEKDPDTGESKTYNIPMKDLRMSMGSVQDISPRINAVDNELSALAGQYQKNINSFATRGERFDWDSKFSEYFKGMDEEELDLYYRNAFPDIRGVDYTPNINPATNQPWGDSDEEQAERERLYNEKRQDLEVRLKQKITGLLADTPLAMTERQRFAMQQQARQTGGSGSTLYYSRLNQDLTSDLINTMNSFKLKTVEQVGDFEKNNPDLIGKASKITVEGKEQVISKNKASDSLLGKTIIDDNKKLTIKDAYFDSDGNLKISSDVYDRDTGQLLTTDQIVDYTPNNIGNILEFTGGIQPTQARTVSTGVGAKYNK